MRTRQDARTLARAAALTCGLSGLLVSALGIAQSAMHVPADQPTIQAAIDAAVNGDSVLVAPGTYSEVLDFHGKAIALLSEQGPLVTIIDGQHMGSVFRFQSGESASSMISGFTIRNGNGSFGSAIEALGSSPTIVDNIIAANLGGAIWGNNSSMVLQRNLFIDHDVCGSWGVVAFVNGSSPNIKNNVFANSRCPALNITLPVGNVPDVANNTFIDNDVGLFVDARVPTSLHQYRNNLFYRNRIGVEVGFGSPGNYPTFLNTLSFANTTNFDGVPDPTGSNGNISGDPRLGGITAFDYHPDAGSAAIDAGTNAAVGGGEVDYHSAARILNGTVDIGAGEFIGPEPVVSLSSSKPWIAFGDSITLTWTASNSSTCLADGAWSGARTLSGSQTVTPSVSGTLTYKVICQNASAKRGGVVSVPVYPPPTITISLAQPSIQQDATTQLTWSTVTATSCTASGAWTNSVPLSGSLVVGPATPEAYTYSLTCVGPGGTSNASVQLTVLPRPTITFTIDHADGSVDTISKLTWSTVDATSCDATGSWSGTKPLSGRQNVGPLPIGTYGYGLECVGPGGYAQSTQTFTVYPVPAITISAKPAGVQVGAKSVITWSSAYATSCTASGPWTGVVATSGSEEVSVTVPGTYAFTLTCIGPGGTFTSAASLDVYAPPEVTISVSPGTVQAGDAATLTWSSTKTTSCTAGNAWTDAIATSGTKSVSQAASGTYVYEITCSGAGGAATSTVTLTVNAKTAGTDGGSKGGGGATSIEMMFMLGLLLLLRHRASSRSYRTVPAVGE